MRNHTRCEHCQLALPGSHYVRVRYRPCWDQRIRVLCTSCARNPDLPIGWVAPTLGPRPKPGRVPMQRPIYEGRRS